MWEERSHDLIFVNFGYCCSLSAFLLLPLAFIVLVEWTPFLWIELPRNTFSHSQSPTDPVSLPSPKPKLEPPPGAGAQRHNAQYGYLSSALSNGHNYIL